MIKLSLYLTTLLLGSNFSTTTMPTVPAYTAPASGVTYIEQQFVDRVNQERQKEGLGTLTINPLLVQVAREHCKDMWENNYFDHYALDPELKTPMKRYLKSLGYTPRWAYLGENLFYCSIVDAERGHRCLMQSPKHKENILNDRYEQIGVGIYIAPDGQFYVTQLFLAQRG